MNQLPNRKMKAKARFYMHQSPHGNDMSTIGDCKTFAKNQIIAFNLYLNHLALKCRAKHDDNQPFDVYSSLTSGPTHQSKDYSEPLTSSYSKGLDLL